MYNGNYIIERNIDMGYNNNNAGMHMIWYREYTKFEGSDSYDDYMFVKNQSRKEEENQTSEEKKKDNKDKVSNNTNKVKKKKIKKEKEYNYFYFDPRKDFGTQEVIEDKYFQNNDIISKNIMYMALKNKIDVKKIIIETEKIMRQDLRTNAKPLEFGNYWSCVPKLENAMVYLSILADKLSCNIQDFFIDRGDEYKELVYFLLEDIIEFMEFDGYLNEEVGYLELKCDLFDLMMGICEYDVIDANNLFLPMNLIITKENCNGQPLYSLFYGNSESCLFDGGKYLRIGATLFSEQKGELEKFVERIIKMEPEWLKKEINY